MSGGEFNGEEVSVREKMCDGTSGVYVNAELPKSLCVTLMIYAIQILLTALNRIFFSATTTTTRVSRKYDFFVMAPACTTVVLLVIPGETSSQIPAF